MIRIVLQLALAGAVLAPMARDAFPQTVTPAARPSAVAMPAAAVEVLDGLDPVLLVKGQEAFGKADLHVTRGSYTYLFASAESRTEFERNPEPYEIQLGGLCARMGGSTGANPNLFAVHEGRVYLFGSDDCRKRFIATPASYISRPVPALPTAPDATTRAAHLIAKAVETMGGAQRVDGVTTYVEKGTTTVSSNMGAGAGTNTIALVVSRRLPDAVRVDRTMTRDGTPVTSSVVSTPDDAFYLGQGRAYPIGEAGRPNLVTEHTRHPLMILRARRDPQFKAAALGAQAIEGGTTTPAAAGTPAAPRAALATTGTNGAGDASGAAAGATAVELVAVRVGGVAATLGIEPATGRIVSLSYVDRDPQGRYGEITRRYADFRPVGGLLLPFSEQATVDDTPAPGLSRTITAIEVNAPLDVSLFTRPTPASQP